MRLEGDWERKVGGSQTSYKVRSVTVLLSAEWRMDGQEAKLEAAGLGTHCTRAWSWRGRTRWVREFFRTELPNRMFSTDGSLDDVSI